MIFQLSFPVLAFLLLLAICLPLGVFFLGLRLGTRQAQRIAEGEREALQNQMLLQFKETTETQQAHLLNSMRGNREEIRQEQTALFNASNKTLSEQLRNFHHKVEHMESVRTAESNRLTEKLSQIVAGHAALNTETAKLTSILSAPQARGFWGESQLRRILETMGMLEHCDFNLQAPLDDGRPGRPDCIVRLPDSRQIIIDAKSPAWYVPTTQGPNPGEEASPRLPAREMFRRLDQHAKDLMKRDYARSGEKTLAGVFIFLPGDHLLQLTMAEGRAEGRIEWLGDWARKGIFWASPTTLIPLLSTIAQLWTQAELTENARKIQGLGQELFERLHTLRSHFDSLGKSLRKAALEYNKTASSLESRVYVSANKMHELGIAPKSSDLADHELANVEPKLLNPMKFPLQNSPSEAEEPPLLRDAQARPVADPPGLPL